MIENGSKHENNEEKRPCDKCGNPVPIWKWNIQSNYCDDCFQGQFREYRESRQPESGSKQGQKPYGFVPPVEAEGGQSQEIPGQNPAPVASSEPAENPGADKPNPGKKRRKQPVETWLYIWGEVEQQREACGDVAAVLTGMSSKGKSRGGYSLENSLLIHIEIDLRLKQMGAWAYGLIYRAYVHGWEWEEAYADGDTFSDSFGKVHKSAPRATGRYYRKARAGVLRQHELRTIRDIIRELAQAMGLDWREEKTDEKRAA